MSLHISKTNCNLPIMIGLSLFTRGVQNFTGADPTNRCRRHCPDCSVDRMSWGRHLDFALCSDAGAVKSLDWEIRNRDYAEPNQYRICSSFYFLFFIIFFMKLIKWRRMYGCYNKSKIVRFMLGFQILKGI